MYEMNGSCLGEEEIIGGDVGMFDDFKRLMLYFVFLRLWVLGRKMG